jgi:catechol-2,3-dioxygenase
VSRIAAARLASVRLNTTSLSNQAQFYTDRWGLEPAETHDGAIYFRAEGPKHHVLSLHDSDVNGLRSIVLELPRGEDLRRLQDRLLAAGVTVNRELTGDFEVGTGRGMSCMDPDGNVVEIVTGFAEASGSYGNRDIKPQDVNHVVLESNDPARLERFYVDLLDFRMTERINGAISFYACNTNHHTVAIAQSSNETNGLNHVAFELRDWEAWARALYHAGERGITRVAGPGRHGPGHNLFCYYRDEDRNVVEYTTEIEQVDESAPPVFHDDLSVVDTWKSDSPWTPQTLDHP